MDWRAVVRYDVDGLRAHPRALARAYSADAGITRKSGAADGGSGYGFDRTDEKSRGVITYNGVLEGE